MRKLIESIRREARRDRRLAFREAMSLGTGLFCLVLASAAAQGDWRGALHHGLFMLVFIAARAYASDEKRWKRIEPWLYPTIGRKRP